MSDAPLTDEQRDALIVVLTRQCGEAQETIRELRAELVAAHEELAALKTYADKRIPFA